MTARAAVKHPRPPPSPDRDAGKWQPPGVRKDTPPKPVPRLVWKDKAQLRLALDLGAEA